MGMLLGSGRRALEEIAQQRVAVFGEDGFGMELDAFHRELAVAQAHDLFDRAVLVLGPCGHFRQSGRLFLSTTSEW